MKLKKIEIFGFKSFADKAVLDFHEGITCVVGPNGCGKSNIADAMRWVFGEQSAKSMRCGAKMSDVIFAGTATRKSLNFCEVTITFSDVNGSLPLEYDEVAVTRKLHRSGESEYFINRQSVRLKDIQNIFLDSGIGRSAFSVFEQGKIDQVIQYAPVERRAIFEEAAGIGRYLLRKKEALRKFLDIDQNLVRIKDIYALIEKQVIVLEEQAVKAKIFQQDKSRLEILEKAVFVAKIKQFADREINLSDERNKLNLAFNEKACALQELEKQLNHAKTAIAEAEEQYHQKNEALHLKRSEKRSRAERGISNQERLKELTQRQKDCKTELKSLESKLDAWSKEVAVLQKEKESLDQELMKRKELFQDKQKLFHSLEKELSKLRDLQVKSHQEKVKQIQKEKEIEGEVRTHQIRLENHEEKKSHLEERLESLKHLIEDLEKQESKRKEELNLSLKRVDDLKLELTALEEKLKSFTQEMGAVQAQIDDTRRIMQEDLARKNALTRLKEDNEGFSEGSKRLLKESMNPRGPLFGLVNRLYEQFTAEAGFEKPLSIALRNYSETLVVDKQEDLAAVLAFAKEKKIKEFSLFCKELLKPLEASSQNERKLESKVKSTALTHHFLKDTFLAEDLSEAFKNEEGAQKYLTDDQLFVDSLGVVHCLSEKSSAFLREGEIKELTQKLNIFEKKFHELKELQEKNSAIKNELLETKSLQDKKVRESEMKLVEANFSYRRVQSDLEKTKKEFTQVLQEIENSSSTISMVRLQLKSFSEKLHEMRQVALKFDEKNVSTEETLNSKLQERAEKAKELAETESLVTLAGDECRKIAHAINLLEVKKQESKSSSLKLEEELKKNLQIAVVLEEEEKQNSVQRQELEAQLMQDEERAKQLSEELKNNKNRILELEKTYKERHAKCQEDEIKLNRLEIQLSETKVSKEALKDELAQRFELEFDQLDPSLYPLKDSLEKTEKEIKQLRQKLGSAQDINLAAIEDFDKQKEQGIFLKNQISDLEVSKEELQNLIQSLDSESRTLFNASFQKIRENFRKNFSILFNGGEADLELLESNDILEAGIEIIAKPPGKKMRSLSLLSGGEKCLTAMALLFSIFEVKAAPFCILDEIDAPLDDSNIERFVEVVKQFIDRCQFIIITHNKRTMAIADRLYGVSMQEKGVSKLLTMEFSKANKRVLELVEA